MSAHYDHLSYEDSFGLVLTIPLFFLFFILTHFICLLYRLCQHFTLVYSFTCAGIKFSAAGREDVDVRTLGRGRPFVCELLNPHRVKFTAEQMQSLEANINSSSKEVAVHDLQIIKK